VSDYVITTVGQHLGLLKLIEFTYNYTKKVEVISVGISGTVHVKAPRSPAELPYAMTGRGAIHTIASNQQNYNYSLCPELYQLPALHQPIKFLQFKDSWCSLTSIE
jgi:hypothetical protein